MREVGQSNEPGTAASRAIALAALAFGIPEAEIGAPTRRGADAALARQVAMYLSHVACRMSLSDVGRAFARDRTTACHACHVVEDRRDDPDFDALLAGLETVMRGVLPKENRHAPAT